MVMTSPPASAPPDPPRALLFDLDGTLVDTVSVRVESWILALGEVGVHSDAAELGGLMGADGKRIAAEIAERHGRPLSDHRAALGRPACGRAVRAAQHGPSTVAARPGGPGGPVIRPDPMGDRNVQPAGSDTGVGRGTRPAQPPRIVDASHVTHAKPAPDLLLAGAVQLGVPARECWYVGDATWDMIAARSAMMTGIGVPSGATDAATLQSAGALLVVGDLGDVLALLRDRGLCPPDRRRRPWTRLSRPGRPAPAGCAC